MTSELELRQASTEALLVDWIGRAFAWGRCDCAHLAAAALEARGHATRLGEATPYRGRAGAVRAMRRLGFASLDAALDGHGLARIPPAAALMGDIVGLPGLHGMTAMTVALGGGRVLGFLEGLDRAGVLQPVQFAAAWRV